MSWNGTTLLFTYSMSNPTVPLLSTLKWSLDFHDFFAKNLPFKAISSELIKTYFSSFLQYLITLCLVDFLSYFPGIFTPAWAPTKKPTRKPNIRPTQKPNKRPTRKPTKKPTKKPTRKLTRRPTTRPGSS